MKLNLFRKSFLTILSIFVLIFTLNIFPQRLKDRTETKNEARQPAAKMSTPTVQQRSPVNNQQPTQQQRQPEVKQVQRPVVNNPTPRVAQQKQTVVTPAPKIERTVVNNPAPRVEQKTEVIDESPPRYYEPKEIERETTTEKNPPAIHSKQVVDEPGSREPVVKQPIRKKQRPSPTNIQHDPSTVINQPEIIYSEPIYEPMNPPIIECGPIIVPECPTIIEYNPVIDYIPSPQRPINRLTLKEQAIQDYYDEYYYDAIIDLNAAIAKDSLDFELYFWRGMAWFKLEKYDSSVVDLSRYLKVYDDDAEAYYYRGLSNFYLINKLEAHHDFLKANKLGYQKAEDMLDKYFKDYHVL